MSSKKAFIALRRVHFVHARLSYLSKYLYWVCGAFKPICFWRGTGFEGEKVRRSTVFYFQGSEAGLPDFMGSKYFKLTLFLFVCAVMLQDYL